MRVLVEAEVRELRRRAEFAPPETTVLRKNVIALCDEWLAQRATIETLEDTDLVRDLVAAKRESAAQRDVVAERDELLRANSELTIRYGLAVKHLKAAGAYDPFYSELRRPALAAVAAPEAEERDDNRIDAAGLDWGEDGVPLGDQSTGVGPSDVEEGTR